MGTQSSRLLTPAAGARNTRTPWPMPAGTEKGLRAMLYLYKGHVIEKVTRLDYIVRTEEGIIVHERTLKAAKAAIDNIFGDGE